jgi:hypothetical protein
MAFPPEQTSPAMSGPPPATQADDLGMLLQTKSHYPKHFKKKKKKKRFCAFSGNGAQSVNVGKNEEERKK